MTSENDKQTGQSDFSSFVGVVDRKYLSFLWKYVNPYRSSLVLAFLLSVPLAGSSALLAFFLKQITQYLEEGAQLDRIIVWVIILLGTVILISILEVSNRYIMTKIDMQISNDIRNDLYKTIQEGSLGFHLRTRSGELSSLISNDVQCASSGIPEIFLTLWLHPVSIICLVAAMLYFNPTISIFIICALPLIAICAMKISKMARQAEHHFLKHLASMHGLMVESLTNVKQVKSLNLEQQQKSMFAEQGRQIIRFRCRAILLKSMVSPVTEITVGIALALMILVAFWQISRNTSSYAAVMGCLAAAYCLKKPIKAMANSIVQLQKSVAAVQRISWLYRQQNTKIEHFSSDYNPPLRTLVLENVSFSYDGRHAVLENISAKFESGERVAIFGPSGVGKTTLVDLIIGFYPCSKGLILANNVDLKSIDPQIWRQEIGVVTQTPFLFDTTIKENVQYGFLQANEKQILEALHLAGADEIIARLPDGLNTVVGERGCRLSGGERKRIALARAIVRPISVLILDEATSELDAPVEEALLNAIDKLSEDLLILNISHRTTILHHCDRALLLQNRKAKEIGHQEILAIAQQEREKSTPIKQKKSL